MKKYVFSNTERFIVWKSYGCKCFWCGEPLEFSQVTIDHLFAEKLLYDSTELNKVKRIYSLPLDFEVNDFCNWLPAHSHCNSKKSTKLIRKSPAFLMIIDQVIKNSIAVKKSFQTLSKKMSKGKIIGKLLSDLENGNISENDIVKLVESTSIYYVDKPELDENELTHLPEGWKIMSVNKQLGKIRVINGLIAGDIPIEIEPDYSWWCPTCHNFGPWDGNKCVICGHYNEPNE